MILSLPAADLERYVGQLVTHHFPDGVRLPLCTPGAMALTLDRVEHCFSRIERKYYQEAGAPCFDHLNGDHMATLLYFYGNTLWRDTGDTAWPTRLFYLNKVMHGLDLFYSVPMPSIFLLVHPVGTVLGKAQYSDYLVVYQNCTVGADTTVYPRFGEGTLLYSRASVLGDCAIGDNVVFAANALVVDSTVASDSVVVGQYPTHRILPNRRSVRSRCFEARGNT